MTSPAGWSATWYGGEHVTVAEPPLFRCRFCYTGLGQLDGREVCETTQSLVHSSCHEEECRDPRCAYLVCTPDRCVEQSECDWCGDARCDVHLPDAHSDCETV